jgi:ubiquinone/menaquinone biosynthesis C-methylase UbiE
MEASAIINEIMQRHGARCSVEEFHTAINVTFHEFESEVYDTEHTCMWESLPKQFNLLVNDWLQQTADAPKSIRLLDIGCGTGLATDSILKTAIGDKITSISLLDTSKSMLQQAKRRSQRWPAPVTTHEGLINSVDQQGCYDLIVTCSVLHHVPDLSAFLSDVRRLQAKNGVFLHLQDPNKDFLDDPELVHRMGDYSKHVLPEWASRLAPRRVIGRISRMLTGKQGQDYISRTNRRLLDKGVIESALTVDELFRVTDIHAAEGEGIAISRLRGWMPDYELISTRSYAFWGELWSDLPPHMKKIEDDLISKRATNGRYVGAIWKLHSA